MRLAPPCRLQGADWTMGKSDAIGPAGARARPWRAIIACNQGGTSASSIRESRQAAARGRGDSNHRREIPRRNVSKHGIDFAHSVSVWEHDGALTVHDAVLDWFRNLVHRAGGGRYQALINKALRRHIAPKEDDREPRCNPRTV